MAAVRRSRARSSGRRAAGGGAAAAHVRCGFVGTSGAGKSSLLNAILGVPVARVGVAEASDQVLALTHEGVTFVDLPGCGAPGFPVRTYARRFGLAGFDVLVLVTAGRIQEHEVALHDSLVREHGRPVLVVRSKVDLDVAEGRRAHGWSAARTVREVRRGLRRDFERHGAAPPDRVYLVSAHDRGAFDLPALRRAIPAAVGGRKRALLLKGLRGWGTRAPGSPPHP